MNTVRYPSGAELYALEQFARHERARAQARLLLGAARWLREALVGRRSLSKGPAHA